MNKFFLIILLFFIISCSKNMNIEQSKQELMQIDIDFSNLSKEKGRNFAFLNYIDDNAALLRTNSLPIEGKEAVSKLFSVEDDQNYTLTWKPLNADISASGDLGYTYGIYELKIDTVVEKGTYATVWKKNSSGKWKFVLDTGNKGISE